MNKDVKQIEPMLCPVCGEFYFSKLDEYELEFGRKPNDVYCHKCGWHYDLEQTKDPNLKNQANALSLTEYKEEYQKKISENPKYDYFEEHMPEPVPHKCPVCGEYIFKDNHSFDICPVCGWEDDDWFEGGGANDMSLDEAIVDFKKHREADPKYKWIKTIKK